MTIIAEREYKTSPARRAAAKARYQAKRGPDYKSLEERRAALSEKKVRLASDRLAKDVTKEHERVYGVRTCINCGEVLPLDKKHFAPRYDIEGELRARCRGCFGRYDSWSEREKAIAARARVTALKKSHAWKQASWTYNAARVMMRFYSELADAARRAFRQGLPSAAFGDALYEIAERHDRVIFLQQNSSDFLAATESDQAELDYLGMAETWERYFLRWNDKANDAIKSQEHMMAELQGNPD